jgi:NAD(P)-dependent dehydrogenase (short-subunit alcohol dehydrogenase family)
VGKLDGKVAVITGGASGIGEASVRLFAKKGAKVVIADIMEDRGQALSDELGDDVVYQKTNVFFEEDVKAVVKLAVDRFGKLDIMFNNAGVGGVSGPVDETDMEAFDITVGVLLKGVFMGIKHAAVAMKNSGSGSIISTASIAGLQTGFAGHTYSACKAAVIHLTRSVAMELGEFGIRVNCICPGAIATTLFATTYGVEHQDAVKSVDPLKDIFADVAALGRSGFPEDIAKAAVFLASDDAEFISGEALKVDGGIGGQFMGDEDTKLRMAAAMGIDPDLFGI